LMTLIGTTIGLILCWPGLGIHWAKS